MDSRLRRDYDGSGATGGGSTGPNRRILCACAARESTWTRACAETTTGGGKQPGPAGGGEHRPGPSYSLRMRGPEVHVGPRLRREYDGEEHRPIPGRACPENTTGGGEDDVTPINLRERVEFSEAKRKLIETFLKS